MEPDPATPESLKQKAAALHSLASGTLASSAVKLAGRSRGIPSGKDFHFYNNFSEFRSPARGIAEQSESLLQSIGSAGPFWGSRPPALLSTDLDDAYDWLVNLNDELLERFGVSMDEFKSLREKEEESGGRIHPEDSEGGFQLVYGKKKKKGTSREYEIDDGVSASGAAAGVKMASRDKKTSASRSRVPFHIPTIPRPQQEFNILVNNSNQQFEHVWLERSEDRSCFVHPLEKLSVLDFVDRNAEKVDPVKPPPLESTPFKLVEGVKELKELAAKLRDAREFAVDLEHNQYRSFQGLTCLMQVSTRTEDFIIDTLKLRVQVGPYLREVFKDPTKRKVMHGADRDILWLQRDFGIYICNLFDTGQASRVMQLERNSLEYLLNHFCGVHANKEYQNADWRLRPLPEEMIKYAREDTHYLLHIYDLMRNKLLLSSSSENDLLLEVYKRSYEVCTQLYEKDLFTDTSYLHIYGLQEADFDSKQLAIVSGLCEWRDKIAREEDESTGYILPNKALLEIARHMPVSSWKLRRFVHSKHPYVERHLNSVTSIIRSSIEHSSSFENISEQLKMGRLESFLQNIEVGYNSKSPHAAEDLMESTTGQRDVLDACTMQSTGFDGASLVALDDDVKSTTIEVFSGQTALIGRCQQEVKSQPMPISETGCSLKLSYTVGTFEKEKMDDGMNGSLASAKKASISSAQITKKQTSAFGALLGSSSSRKKFNPDNRGTIERDKNVNMQCMSLPVETAKLEAVIPLKDELDDSESHADSMIGDDGLKRREWFPRLPENGTTRANKFELKPCKDAVDRIRMWIRMYNIPLEYWTAEGLSYLASAVGVPLYADSVTENRKRINYARICVEIDASKPLIDEFDVVVYKDIHQQSASDTVTIQVKYQWKPPICNHCIVFGHSSDSCLRASTTAKSKVSAVPGPVEVCSDSEDWHVMGRKGKTTSAVQGAGITANIQPVIPPPIVIVVPSAEAFTPPSPLL